MFMHFQQVTDGHTHLGHAEIFRSGQIYPFSDKSILEHTLGCAKCVLVFSF
jgi:hypothetical protein